MTVLTFQVFSQQHDKVILGESPCRDPKSDDLWWVDVEGRKLLNTNLVSGETKVWDTPECIGFVVLTGSGAPAVGMETGIFSFAPDTGVFAPLVQFDQAGARFNDATVDQGGRLWASTMALDAQTGRAAIHLITEDLRLEIVVEGLSIPNGMAVDLDRGRLFYSDSHPDSQNIWVTTVEDGCRLVGKASVFASTKKLGGRPDGAALDQDGFYWIAGVDGSEIYVFNLEGGLHATIPVPFPAPTKICFSGNDSRLVVVTSKCAGDFGGYLARGQMPASMAAGVAQPYWNLETGSGGMSAHSAREI